MTLVILFYKLTSKKKYQCHKISRYITITCSCVIIVTEKKNHIYLYIVYYVFFLELLLCFFTFFMMFQTGSTMLLASTVPQVTLGNKGVNAK